MKQFEGNLSFNCKSFQLLWAPCLTDHQSLCLRNQLELQNKITWIGQDHMSRSFDARSAQGKEGQAIVREGRAAQGKARDRTSQGKAGKRKARGSGQCNAGLRSAGQGGA